MVRAVLSVITCDILTFQTLVRKLQNLRSATGAGLLNYSVRYVDELRRHLNNGWSNIYQTVI